MNELKCRLEREGDDDCDDDIYNSITIIIIISIYTTTTTITSPSTNQVSDPLRGHSGTVRVVKFLKTNHGNDPGE